MVRFDSIYLTIVMSWHKKVYGNIYIYDQSLRLHVVFTFATFGNNICGCRKVWSLYFTLIDKAYAR
jgi:hypothetical protein